jgi:periplasmic protein CpxP/Spy
MNYFTNQKLLIWSVIILVILNLATLSTFWFFGKRMHHQRQGKHGNEVIQKFLSHELNLSKEQEIKFIQSDKIFLSKIAIVFESIHNQKFLLSEKKYNIILDTLAVDSIIKIIAKNYADIEKLTYYHFKEISDFCNEKQREKLKLIQKRLLKFCEPEEGHKLHQDEQSRFDND